MEDYLLIFDIDGTLTDSVTAYQQCFTDALQQLQISKTGEYGDFKHHTDRYIFREIYFRNKGNWPEEEVTQQFFGILSGGYQTLTSASAITEIKGAVAFLKQLRDNNICCAFATGSVTAPALQKLALFNFADARIVTACSDCHDSREEIVLNAKEKAGKYYGRTFTNTNCIIIGDGKWDYITARNLKMGFLGIGNNKALQEMLAQNPEAIWKDFEGRSIQELPHCVVWP